MMNQEREGMRTKYSVMQFGVMGLLFAFLVASSLPSCTHDLFSPIEPDPMDTITNPLDTIGTPCDPNTVYFESQILPLIKSNCAKSGCHDAVSHEEGLVLESYQNLMGSKLVKPNNVSGSKLYKVISTNESDDRMPQPPNQKLSNDQIALIAKWIEQGAKDLSCDESAGACDTTAVSYSGYIAPVLATYCVGCHSGGNPSGGITLNSYNAVQSLAVNGRLAGAITWASGYQKMPQGSGKLPSCTINKIKAWVNNGATNN